MPCRKWIRSVCSITGRADGRADGRALANRRWILLGFGKVWTLDPAWIWSSLGKSVFLVSIFSLGKSLGLFWSAWGQISLPGRIWESFWVVWGSSRTSQGAFGSHFGVSGLLRRRTGVDPGPPKGRFGGHFRIRSRRNSEVWFRSRFLRLPKRSFLEKSTSCRRNAWFGGVAVAVDESANAVGGAAPAVGGEAGGRGWSQWGGRGGFNSELYLLLLS